MPRNHQAYLAYLHKLLEIQTHNYITYYSTVSFVPPIYTMDVWRGITY